MRFPLLLALAVTAGATARPATAQGGARADSARTLRPVTVTATRRPTDVRDVPAPVTVLDSATIRERLPNTAADLLRDAPGVDIVGTGPNQSRPVIRGQRGQRILLLQDGLRLNNSRRQQDFGELPALVDVTQVERVEIVRGPSSVLYGSDAIGGVINLVTRAPAPSATPRINGTIGYGWSGAGNQQRGEGSLSAARGPFSLLASGTLRNASDYVAPGGTFGDLTLANRVDVLDSGVRDHSMSLHGMWRGTGATRAWLRYDNYGARDAGFGLVEPRILGDTASRVRLTYPTQSVWKTAAGFEVGGLGLPVADRLDVSLYTQGNTRDFASAVDVYVPAGPGRTATIRSRSFNATDVRTSGMRVEAVKAMNRAIVTWGVDGFRDDARSADSSWSQTTGFGPTPTVRSGTTPSLANAVLTNVGVFAQADWRLHDRLSVVTGVRGHDVQADTRPTAGLPDSLGRLSASNRTAVYAINGIYRLTDRVSLVSAWGRGFRAPNLIERYFAGASTDGTALQIANPGLAPETSQNLDLGARVAVGRVEAEAFWFRNNIRDGIVMRPTGRTVGRLAEFQNINTSRLRTTGYEASVQADLGRGLSLATNYTKLDTKDPDTPDLPVAGTYSSKLNAELGFRPASRRWWAAGAVRHQGRQQDINLGASPVGGVLPAFTVVNLRGGARLANIGGRPQDLTVAFNNIGNRLYAEAANSAFFRPEPGRHVVLSLRLGF